MKRIVTAFVAGLLVSGPAVQAGGVATELKARYRAEGAGPFSAARGQSMWTREFEHGGGTRRCADCHTADLTRGGEHVRTGKPIEPLAPSANPERLTDMRKVEKWFRRNCKWTLGRTCTPQEKGDLLSFIQSQ